MSTRTDEPRRPVPFKNSRNWAIAVAILALLIRLAFFVRAASWEPAYGSSGVLGGDGFGYDRIARTLLSSHRFAISNEGPAEALRTPAYPVFVAICYSLSGGSPSAVILAQIALDVLITLLIGRLVSARLGPRVGIFAMLAYALDPLAIQHSNMLLSETLFMLWIMLAAIALIPALVPEKSTLSMKRAFVAGVSIGAAILTRPVAVLLPVLISPFVLATRGTSVVLVARRLAVWVLGVAIVVLPWIARNQQLFHAAEISTSGAYNLLVLQAAPVEADLRGITVGAAAESLVHESVMLRVREHGPEPVDAFTESRYWKRVAVERLRAHPALAIKHFLMGVGFSFVNVGTAGLADILRFHSSGQTVVVHEARSFAGLAHAWITRKSPAQISVGLGIGAYLACVYVLAMFGAWLLFRAGRLGRWECFCMLMVAYFVLVAGAAGEARFRLPAVPFYVGFVGVGIVAIVDIAWGRRER